MHVDDAWRRRGWNHYCMGRLRQAEDDLTKALAAFESSRHDEHLAVAGDDPLVLALANLCWLSAMRQPAAEVRRRAEAAVKAALTSSHAVSTCYGLTLAGSALQRAGQWDRALELAEQSLEIARQKELTYWVALGQVVVGYDLALQRGRGEDGRIMVQAGLKQYRETQAHLLLPFILARLAEVHAAVADVDAAHAALREAMEVTHSVEAHGFMPELLLQRGRLLSAPTEREDRRRILKQGLALAEKHGADAVILSILAEAGPHLLVA